MSSLCLSALGGQCRFAVPRDSDPPLWASVSLAGVSITESLSSELEPLQPLPLALRLSPLLSIEGP